MITITGAGSFVGNLVVEQLCNHGKSVRSVDIYFRNKTRQSKCLYINAMCLCVHNFFGGWVIICMIFIEVHSGTFS